MFAVKDYIFMAVIAAMGAYMFILSQKVDSLESSLQSSQVKVLTGEVNLRTCKASLTKQNEKFESLSADYDNARSAVEHWKAKPAEVRYKYIYKTIGKVKSNECNDTKSMLDSVRNIDFNSL